MIDRSIVAHALAYTRRGWSIVPAPVEGKRALIPWKPWQAVAPDLELIERWWRRWPRANVAVVTGRVSGLIVIDVDVDKGGPATLAALEAKYGALPRSAVVQTPSGGWHIYLAHPGFRVRTVGAPFGSGLDLRGDGGLALAPPSRRGDAVYRWLQGEPDALPPVPAAWCPLLRPPQPITQKAAVARSRATGAAQAAGGGSVAALAAWLARRSDGEVNNALYWAALRAAEAGIDEAGCGPLVEAAVAASRWPAEQVRRDGKRTVASALAASRSAGVRP